MKFHGNVSRPCSKCAGSGNEYDPVAVGKQMAKLRDGANKTQEAVATAMDITPGYISDLERGLRQWNKELIAKYEEAVKK